MKQMLSLGLLLLAALWVVLAGFAIWENYQEVAAGTGDGFPFARLLLLSILAGVFYSASQYVNKR